MHELHILEMMQLNLVQSMYDSIYQMTLCCSTSIMANRWNQVNKYNYHYSAVNDFICDKIANKCFDSQFSVSPKVENWKDRTDSEISAIGYTNGEGVTVRCDILKKETKKIIFEI